MRRLLATLLLLTTAAWAGTCGNSYLVGPITITQDHTKVGSTDQTDFVSYICFNGACRTSYPLAALKTVGNGGSIQNTASNTASITGPADFIICDASASGNTIPFVIPYYNLITGGMEMWYKKTLSHTVDTSVYLFFNNAAVNTSQQDIANTFSNNFLHVYTFGDGTTSSFVDLLGTNTLSGSPVPTPAVGVNGGGLHFNTNAATSSSAYTTATTNITFSIDFQWGGANTLESIWKNGSGGNGYGLEIGTAGCANSGTMGLLFNG